MTIATTLEDQTLLAALDGRLDTSSSPELLEALKEQSAGVETLVLDFEQIDYISSAGIRAVLILHKQMAAQGGALILRHLNSSVMSVLKMTKLDTVFAIEK
ncbi:STAS domain-containing protein [Eubacterium sp.]|uniref:STAS domain-containing protein n=1 Tax=Eubacterium sp. TaxID=142586 RepID=UPI002FC97A0F